MKSEAFYICILYNIMAYLHRQQQQRGTTRNTGYGNKNKNSIQTGYAKLGENGEYENPEGWKAAEDNPIRYVTGDDNDAESLSGHYVKTGDIIQKCIKGVCYVGTAAYIAHMMGLNPYAGGRTKRNKQRQKKKKKSKNKRKKTSRRAL